MTAELVVGVGHCMVDYLGLLPRFPEQGGSAEIAEFSQQSGGAGSTALAALAIFGAKTRFVGKVSDDHFGRFIRAGFDGLGTDTSLMVVEKGRVSPFAFSTVEMAEGRRTMFWSRGSVSPLSADDIDLGKVLDGAVMLLLDSSAVAAQIPIAAAARERGIHVVVDAGDGGPEIEKLVELADTLIISERVATEVAPASELDAGLRELQKLGPQRCVITLGAEGAIGVDPEKNIHEEPAFRVEVKDTTGAGDVFFGAFAYSLLQSWALPESMRFASVAAGLTCRRLGARAGIPELALVREQVDTLAG